MKNLALVVFACSAVCLTLGQYPYHISAGHGHGHGGFGGFGGGGWGGLPSLPTIRIHAPPTGGSGGGWGSWGGLKGFQIPNDLADKLFPFTIRIATHGEPHLP